MATISTSGIESGRIIRSAHVLRIIEALDGSETNDILISGSLITTGSVGVTGSVDVIGNITGSAFTGSFAGDGSNLTGVTGEWDGTHNGNADITGSFNVSGSTGLTGSLTVSGSVVLSGSYSGSFQGDGSNLSGVTGEWDGSHNGNATITGSFNVSGSTGLTGSLDVSGSITGSNDIKVVGGIVSGISGSVIPFYFANQGAFPSATTYHGAIAHSHSDGAMYFAHGGAWNQLQNSSGPFSGSFSGSFQGDGSNLSGITGEWDGTRDGNADITGSFNVSGSTGLTGSLTVSGSSVNINHPSASIVFENNGNNIAIGYRVLDPRTNGTHNVGVGYEALKGIVTGTRNIGIGSYAGQNLDSGGGNVAIGYNALYDADVSTFFNIAIGDETGRYLASNCRDNVLIGAGVGPSTETGNLNDKLYIGSGSGDTPLIFGEFKSQSLTINNAVSASIFSGSFYGNGSNLTGITGEWDGTRNGNSEITGSLIISGSDANVRVTGSVHISNVLELAPIHPLPTDKPTGSLASSGSAGSVKPFFWDGTNWNALY
tara:strand:+ start:1414 stop:3042 length:1629 start_codon:yes stop_codon:yes gene_type:complete